MALSIFEDAAQAGTKPRAVARALNPPAMIAMGVFPRGTSLYDGETELEKAYARIELVVNMLADAGISGLTFGAGAVRSIPKGVDRASGEFRFATILRYMSDKCTEAGIGLFTENLPSVETNIFNEVEEIVTFLDKHELWEVKIVYDLRAALVQRDDPQAPERHVERIGHLHIPYHSMEDEPFIKAEAFLERMLRAGYTERVSVEPYQVPIDAGTAVLGDRLKRIASSVSQTTTR